MKPSIKAFMEEIINTWAKDGPHVAQVAYGEGLIKHKLTQGEHVMLSRKITKAIQERST